MNTRVRELALEFARTHLSGSSAARLDFLGDERAEDINALLEQPAPFLTHLHLLAVVDSVPKLTPKLLGGHCSNLRSLVLLALTDIEADPPALPNLQQLEIDVASANRPDYMAALFSLLDGAPLLQDLSLIRGPALGVDKGPLLNFTRQPVHLPHLRLLRIDDYIQHVLHFLRLLPEPTHGLHLFIYRWAADGIWSPPGSEDFTNIFARLCSFWTSRTGTIDLPGGHMQCTRELGFQSSSIDTMRFASPIGSPIRLVFEARCKVTCRHPLMDRIRTLHLQQDRTGPSLGAEDGSGSAYMTHLERIVLEDPGTVKPL